MQVEQPWQRSGSIEAEASVRGRRCSGRFQHRGRKRNIFQDRPGHTRPRPSDSAADLISWMRRSRISLTRLKTHLFHIILQGLHPIFKKTESSNHGVGANPDRVCAAHHHLDGIFHRGNSTCAVDMGFGADKLSNFKNVPQGERLDPRAGKATHRVLALEVVDRFLIVPDVNGRDSKAVGHTADRRSTGLIRYPGNLCDPPSLQE